MNKTLVVVLGCLMMRHVGVRRKELIDVSPLRADADILQEKVHLAAEILMSGGAATMINRGNQEHFDVWTLRALIKMALKGVLEVTSAALVVVYVHGHVESYLHTKVCKALGFRSFQTSMWPLLYSRLLEDTRIFNCCATIVEFFKILVIL